MQCKVCNKEIKDLLLSLTIHIKIHSLTLIEYYTIYEKFERPRCCFCQDFCKIRKGLKFCKTCGKKECIRKDRKSRKHTEEFKERQRKKRFDYLKKRLGKTAWEKRSKNELSELELWFVDNVINKHNLERKYDIINEYAEYPYFIDFAFINIKLAVEIDGPAHFRNGKQRFQHDLKKDQDLLNKGWKVVRFSYDELNETTINNFLKLLNDLDQYKYEAKKLEDHVYRYTTVREIKIKDKEAKRQEQKHKKELDDFEKTKNKIKLLEESSIDFSKTGWVKQAAKILNMKTQKINKWMKLFMNDFYLTKCKKINRNKRGVA